MYLVCKTGGDDICGFYDYASVHLNQASAQRMLLRRDLILALPVDLFPAFYCVELFDCACEYGSQFDLPGVTDALCDDDSGQWLTISEDPLIKKDLQTAAETCKYTRDGVIWNAMPKHSSGHLETPEITWAQIEEIAAGSCPF